MFLRTRSGFAKTFNQGFVKRDVEILHLYRRFLYEIRHESKDESRIILCLPNSDPYKVFLTLRYKGLQQLMALLNKHS